MRLTTVDVRSRKNLPGVEALEQRTLLSAARARIAMPQATPISITLNLDSSTSPAGDYAAVAKGRMMVTGKTAPGARVVLTSLTHAGRPYVMGRAVADAGGVYRLRFPCPMGTMPLTVRAVGASGSTATASMPLTRANQAVVWDTVALQVIRDAKAPPPDCSRALAIMSVAVFDAVNAIDPQYKPYAVSVNASRTASPDAAAAAAAYTALVGLYPSQKPMLDAQLQSTLAAIPNGLAKRQGVVLGTAVANQVLTLRSNDGSSVHGVYNPGSSGVGVWVPTPPAYKPALAPAWGQVTPFALTSSTQFDVPPPPAVTSAQYAVEVMQVEAIGGKNSTVRTAEQTQIAAFWADQIGPTFDPPGHWNQIATNAAVSTRSSLQTTARMLATLNIALADAGIAAWQVKYEDNTWRPVTAIQTGSDGVNPLITADPTWQPLWPTPPFPAYVSGHSTFSSAAATVLDSFYGKNFAFTDTGDPSQHLTSRSFTSFDQAAQEAGMSRIYGGIHYMSDNTAGLALGSQIGTYVLQTQLLPIARPANRA